MDRRYRCWQNGLKKYRFLRETESNCRRRGRRARRLRLEGLEGRYMLATLTVNTAIDEQDFNVTDGDISLRDAIEFASPGDTINFSSPLDGVAITLNGSLGELAIEETLTIDASMLSNGLTIDASGADPTPTQNNFDGIRIFNITDPTSGSNPPLVTLRGLALKGGDANGFGGAISSTASLEIENCMITDNHARRGGAIDAFLWRNSTITITNSVISGNSTISEGGAIYWQSQ